VRPCLEAVRARHRSGGTGAGDSGAANGGANLKDDDGGVKTVLMRNGSFFAPAPVASQKAELQRRDEMAEAFATNLSSDAW